MKYLKKFKYINESYDLISNDQYNKELYGHSYSILNNRDEMIEMIERIFSIKVENTFYSRKDYLKFKLPIYEGKYNMTDVEFSISTIGDDYYYLSIYRTHYMGTFCVYKADQLYGLEELLINLKNKFPDYDQDCKEVKSLHIEYLRINNYGVNRFADLDKKVIIDQKIKKIKDKYNSIIFNIINDDITI